jgi:hypothetical protein
MKILYFLINSFKGKKPYFTFSKYLKYVDDYEPESNGDILLDYLNERKMWMHNVDGEKLFQVSRLVFKTKNKKYNYLDIDKEWVEWR